MRKPPLDAQVCREIVRDLLDSEGPMTISQLAARIRPVFRVDTAYLAMTICGRKAGFVVDSGVVYSKPNSRFRSGK